MMNSIYFADWIAPAPEGLWLRSGFCFDAAGRFVAPVSAGGRGIILDDRHPPSAAGIREAAARLRDLGGVIVCDFERPPSPAAEELIRALADCEVVVPEAYAGLPHSAVLVGPYRPGIGFRRWLNEKKTRCGRVVLDGGEIRMRVGLGGSAPAPGDMSRAPGTAQDYPCSGAMCRYRREGGEIVFFDTEETVLARARLAQCPVILCAGPRAAAGDRQESAQASAPHCAIPAPR